MKDYRTLQVWQRAHALVLAVYGITERFPKEEVYGVIGQLRRAAVSVPTNLAEGCGRDSDPELKRFVDIAHGSASEVEYLLLLTHELGYLDAETHTRVSGEISELKKMLGALARKLKADR